MWYLCWVSLKLQVHYNKDHYVILQSLLSNTYDLFSGIFEVFNDLHLFQNFENKKSPLILGGKKLWGVIKKFAILTGKLLFWSLFLISLQYWISTSSLKRDSKYCKIFKNTSFEIFKNTSFTEHLWWLLLLL